MLQLHAKVDLRWNAEPRVVRVTTAGACVSVPVADCAFLLDGSVDPPDGYDLYLGLENRLCRQPFPTQKKRICWLPESMGYLQDGDVLRISPLSGDISVLYRRHSPFNSILLTERCNSFCLMCSQPPRNVDDSYLLDVYLQAIPLMDRSTPAIGITGGEPTLLGDHLLLLIESFRQHLPSTALHMLSNGRMFNYLAYCQAIATLDHPDLVIGIPLYSDIASRHDFVVQAKGAFDQTLRGIMNLARCNLRIELRVVIHRHTIDRLPDLARFIARNLPYVEHVALMGLEPIGFARTNYQSIWSEPADYQNILLEATECLATHGVNVSIYNHQLCTLDRRLWPYARQSISDWKNEYLDACQSCAARSACGGFFSSAAVRHSNAIRALSAEEFESD